MAVKLIIAQEAQQDIEEAYGWFEERRQAWEKIS